MAELRTETENMIMDRMIEIWDLYKQYNPDGDYLSLTFKETDTGDDKSIFYSLNNAYWAEDYMRPLDGNGRVYTKVKEGRGIEVGKPTWHIRRERLE